PKHLKSLHLYLKFLHIYHYNTLILLMNFDPKTSIKNKILKTRSKNLTASLWITWGAENKKPIKTMCCKKEKLQVPNTPLPTLWKSSIHAGSAHITYRKTVRMCSTWRRIHFRFLAHSLANARSLGLRRADDTITVLAAPPAR
ncbi:hypothetical protein, partial [Escherichia coli]|uniref:hypothetical protein n=1 Tax=Escherichia coli TaxID=562 RepID=UPI00207BAFE2